MTAAQDAWGRLNAFAAEKLRRGANFFSANAALLALTIAAGVFAHGYQLTHLTFSIDEEVVWQGDAGNVWLGQRRWGMYLLHELLFPQAIYPFTNAALAIVLLALSSVLVISRIETRFAAKAVFSILFVSFPTFAHIQYHEYMGAQVAFAVLLVVLAERLIATVHVRPMLLVPAWFMLAVATASHQSLLFAFTTLAALTLASDAFKDQLSVRAALARVGFAGALVVSSVVTFYAVSYVCGLRSDGYVETYFRWGSSRASDVATALWTAARPFLRGTPTTYALVPTAVVPLVALLFVGARSKSPLLKCVFTVLLVASPLTVHLVFGTWMSSRSMMGVPFAFAGIWYLLFTVSPPVIRGAIVAFSAYALALNSSLISRVSLAQELTYKADSLVAERLLALIYDTRPRLSEDGTPLAFVGALDHRRSKLFTGEEAFGGSFWQWDSGNPYRMYLFLQSLGLPVTVSLASPAEWPRAKALAKDMPMWPDRNCVQFRGGLVIVKLSNP